MKQTELAELLGVNEMTVVNWETGKTNPTAGKCCGLVVEFLNGKVGYPWPEEPAKRRPA